jgi:hypothetical protein
MPAAAAQLLMFFSSFAPLSTRRRSRHQQRFLRAPAQRGLTDRVLWSKANRGRGVRGVTKT